MASWVVSAHGGVDKSTSRIRRLIAPTEKFKYSTTFVPSGVQLVMFTKQGDVFYGGDPELDAFIAGNENDPVITGRIHKTKTQHSIVPDYNAYGTTDFRSGIYEVGRGKVFDLPDGSVTPLSHIFKAAQTHNVDRIYWLCCACLH